MYSALKVNGKKLYELAREGKEVERKTRKVQILDIQIKEVKLPRVRMEVSCSKGTYIRTLCHDIGEELGCGGCMRCFRIKKQLL
ncbi:tRNA pseudouridine synthase B [Dorea longicatena]|nr:tRNA pseudouridine synthase B [Dorea longicatena]